MPEVPLDDDDPVLAWQHTPELVGDNLSAHAATKNQDGLCVSHGVLHLFPLRDQRAVRPLHPVGEFLERAPMRGVRQLGVGDASRVHAG